jgi:putative transposase
MCAVLNLSRSGFYAYCGRGMSARAKANQEVVQEIRRIYAEGRGEYGSPTIYRVLQEQGIRVNRKRIVRLMRHIGLRSKIRRQWKQTTKPCKARDAAPNLLKQHFTTTGPNRVWLSDITFIQCERRWLYLTTIEDMWSRRIVGYAITDHLRAEAVMEALRMALRRRQITPGLIFHSDRGVQYTDRRVRAILGDYAMVQSMSSTGNCYDNAMAESFFATLKKGHALKEKFESLEDARIRLFEYLEIFYNRVRRHSSLGYKSPVAYEQLHMNLA